MQQIITQTAKLEVVKSIFKVCLECKGNKTTAQILQEKQIFVPMAYWQSKGLTRGGKKTQPGSQVYANGQADRSAAP